jgi:molybdopterin synthase catalytic subunit
MIAITPYAIDLVTIISGISRPEAGGIDVFVGTVRNTSKGRRVRELEYSAYVPMAEKLLKEIEHEIRNKWRVCEVALVHRVGTLTVGEIAVVTAISSPHRKEAFEACRYAIDRIKSVVPIWKKEILEEGREDSERAASKSRQKP